MALTRIVELKSGAIEIDDVDVSKLGISDLRNAITMIPQDPIMFTSTLRYNLDPFEESTDERITELVKKAGLDYLLEGVSKQELKDKEEAEAEKAKKKAALSDDEGSDETKNDTDEPEDKKEEDKKEEKTEDEKKKEEDDKDKDKGLNFKVKEEGKNLSVGERQLLCIIRAILRCNKIVVLDEATANIDVITEQAIQQLITEEFKDATVLTIAHRLNTIIKSDRVLVMDKGMAIEYDSPKALMANPDSKFSNMLKDKKR
jgi:ABC-type multidrug transport system fused ATPase/permease subunit